MTLDGVIQISLSVSSQSSHRDSSQRRTILKARGNIYRPPISKMEKSSMSFETIWPWIGFNLFVLAMLAVDLGIFHRKAHTVSLKEAAIWSGVWITLALIFNAGLYVLRGPDSALQFFTGWLIEKSLSVDNIFVFV